MTQKILIVSHPSVLEVNRTIYRELAKAGDFEILLLAPSTWKGDLIQDLKCAPSENDARFRVVHSSIYFSGNGSLYFFQSGWKRALGTFKPDFIFVDEEPWSLSALQIYSHFSEVKKAFFTKQNLKKNIPLPFQWIQNWIFKKSAFAFSVASEVTEVLRWKGFQKPIFDLPHSYDPVLFKRQSRETTDQLKKSMGIPLDKTVISYFGRLTEEKGIDDLLEAQKAILSERDFQNSFFLWVGNGPYAEVVEKNIRSYRQDQSLLRPAFTHDQVGNALSLSDVLVLPSRTVKNWKEQFGRILVEAMAAGSAVLGSDSGEIPHLIKRAKGGLVFREKNVEELTHQMKQLLTEPELLKQLKDQGNHYVSTELTHASVAKNLASYLSKK